MINHLKLWNSQDKYLGFIQKQMGKMVYSLSIVWGCKHVFEIKEAAIMTTFI